MDNLSPSKMERFYSLLSRQISGSISPEEHVELKQILESCPDLSLQAELFEGMWQQEKKVFPSEDVKEAYIKHLLKYKSEFLLENNPYLPDGTYQQTKNKNSAKNLFILRSKQLLAASFLLTILLSSLFLFYFRKPNLPEKSNAISSVITKYGNKSKISLPDGSEVWLNAGSRIDYNSVDFNKNLREVNLSGEAYFDIAHNAAKPFIVSSGNMRIKVLGTMFNVKAYPEEQKIETSLIKGSVEITLNDRPYDKYILSPNEKLVISNYGLAQKSTALHEVNNSDPRGNRDIVALKKVDYSNIEKLILETAWVQNKLVFKSETFSDLAKRMERWYDIDIQFRNSSKEDLKFTGIFTTETIQQALKAMQVVHVFSYVKENNIIYID
jgi:ferric-dicitrate binding protein FerR (iron transport regulator)